MMSDDFFTVRIGFKMRQAIETIEITNAMSRVIRNRCLRMISNQANPMIIRIVMMITHVTGSNELKRIAVIAPELQVV